MSLDTLSRQDYRALITEDRVHGRLYRDPAVFEDEVERIWSRVWVYLGHASELPKRGDYLRRSIGRQPIVLVRGADDHIRVFFNRCRHRANLLCHLDKGNAKALTCPYHGWSYAIDGQLLARSLDEAYPAESAADDFNLTPIPRMAAYRGLIFGSLAADGITLDEHLGGAKEYLDLILDRSPEGEVDLGGGMHKMRYRGNWKMLPENSLEGAYHGRFIHKFAFDLADRRTGRDRSSAHADSVRYLPGGHMVEDFRTTKFTKPPSRTPAHESYWNALVAAHGEARVNEVMSGRTPMLFVFPNLMYIQTHFRRLHPVSVDETHVYYQPAMLKGAPVEINRELLRHHEGYFGPAGFLASDDIEILERSQVALQAEGNEWLYLGRGAHREKELAGGAIAGHAMDENQLRGFWRHYTATMMKN
jgi:phenylpropionate dioxygenase-like ring-hydroxylating dioxygenase large terminal subunit